MHACTRYPVLAASPAGTYDPGSGPDPEIDVDTNCGGLPAPPDEVAAVARLAAAVEVVGAVDLSSLSDQQLDAHLGRLRQPIAALEAARSRAFAEFEGRAAPQEDPARRNAEVQERRRRAAKGQRMTPSEAKRSAEAGSHAAANPRLGAVFGAGEITPTQVRLIGDALERLAPEQRAAAEEELLELARNTDGVAFGRQLRGYLARNAPRTLHRQEQDNHRQRRFRMTDTPDGGVAFSGLAYGIAAELARNALDAFRRPDAADEHRTPEQRSADAFEQLCDAALRLGDAPTVHGERPQVILVVEEGELQREAGSAVFAGSGQPISLAEAGTLLTDCAVSRVVRGADNTPIEVTRNVRTVPQGLWRALVVRDGGCRWEGCDAPASWCDVAHGEHPYRAKGHLSPDNALLLCRRHHRRFDKGPWRVEIVGDEVTFHREESPYVHPLDRAALAAEADARDQRQRGDPADAAAPADQATAGPPIDQSRAAPANDQARAGPPTDRVRAGPVPGDPVPAEPGVSAATGHPSAPVPAHDPPEGAGAGAGPPGEPAAGAGPPGEPAAGAGRSDEPGDGASPPPSAEQLRLDPS